MIKTRFIAPFAAAFILLLACSYKEQLAFTVSGSPLYAVSKEAEGGVLSLSAPARLEYSFQTPFWPREDSSLEIEYLLKPPRSFSFQNLEPRGAVILDLGNEAWELPVEFSFMGELVSEKSSYPVAEETTVKYAVPLSGGEAITKIILKFEPNEAGKREDSPRLEIKGLSVVPRNFGFAGGQGVEGKLKSFSLTPFVYVKNASLIIDPLPRFKNGGMEFRLYSAGEDVSVKAGNTVIESSSSNLRVPPELISRDDSFPLSINGEKINEARLIPAQQRPSIEPMPADPGMILSWPRREWRNPHYEVFAWDDFPSILIFDMGDYDVQDRFLKRLAFFVEKAGYRGRIMQLSEIENERGWNAHDYRAESLADFYETARRQNVQLIKEELELQEIILNAGIIRKASDGSIIPGEGAIISISRESPDYLRWTFMVHECYHGLFFIDGDFRDFCETRWDSFSNTGKRFLISFFDFRHYDTSDHYLLVNEFMAYLLQQRVSAAATYFGELRPKEILDISPWRRAHLPAREEILPSGNSYWPEIAEIFTAEAAVFSRYVNERWGFEAGSLMKTFIR